MSNLELKSRVFQKLESAEDHLLKEILCLIQIETNQENLVEIPDFFKDKLDKSIAQMEAGNTVPNADVEKSIEKWLYK